jgi:outer membrane protein OmpA-like peptidoglycan-associated protein
MALAQTRANAVADYLATAMILPREQIETEAEQQQNLRAELDGTVEILIEHAD